MHWAAVQVAGFVTGAAVVVLIMTVPCVSIIFISILQGELTYNIISLPLSLKLIIFLTLYTYIVVTNRYMYAKR